MFYSYIILNHVAGLLKTDKPIYLMALKAANSRKHICIRMRVNPYIVYVQYVVPCRKLINITSLYYYDPFNISYRLVLYKNEIIEFYNLVYNTMKNCLSIFIWVVH